uniref:Apple domain-containing protein n=1 Tax=Stomoxys calcitrans TaxID=35570 RepID=A0A1I8QFB9_STOCA
MIRWKLMDCCTILWHVICIAVLMPTINCLTVDNQLVSARNDCFERIALEAMMPFEKTFRTEDTNSLRSCKEKCLAEGDKCQSISFGVHRRGNGTCQLSKEKYSTSGGRPNGVIFDPDFDLYSRKTNCFDLDEPEESGGETKNYGTSLAPTTPVFLPTRPSPGTPVLVVDPTPTVITTVQDDGGRYPTPTTGYSETTLYNPGPASTLEPSTPTTAAGPGGDRLYFSQDIYPLFKYPTLYDPNYPSPNQDVYIPGGYASNAPEVADRPTSYDSTRPRPPPPPPQSSNGPPKPIFGLGYGNGYSYGTPESYNPSTMRPEDSGYSPNAPRPNPNRDSLRPGPGYDNSHRDPMRLPGYDNTTPPYYSRPGSGQDSPYGSRPANDRNSSPYGPRPNNPNGPYGSRPGGNGPRPDNDRGSQPPYGPRPENDRGTALPYGSARPDGRPPPPYNSRPENDRNPLPPYSTRPENDGTSPPYGSRPSSQRPGDFMDYTNRPDAPADGSSTRPPSGPPYGPNSGNSYDTNYVRRNGTAPGRPGGYQDDKKINTYFNPDDYLPGNKKRPGSFEDDDRLDGNRIPMKACFRRVLAGKRVAPHWVRRTIACERVEECMRECGREKRFTCEGFNYRLDPSGHGQGDCELIEIPLAQIDLYSSANRRDSNLLRHPDYDYYERDRNAPPSCRYNVCRDCGSKLPPPHYNKPSGQWSDKPPYRDDHYLPSPPSGGGGGGGSSGYYSRPPSSSSLEHYGPSGPSAPSYESHGRPPPPHPPPYSYEHHSGSHEFSSHSSGYYEHSSHSGYGSSGSSGPGPIDRYDIPHGDRDRDRDRDRYRPGGHYPSKWEPVPSSGGYDGGSKHSQERYRPPYRPGPEYTPYRPSGPESYHPGPPPPPPPPSSHNYLDRDRPAGSSYKKGSGKYIPYLIGTDNEWDHRTKPKDPVDFNYFDLGPPPRKGEPPHESNSVLSYPGSSYGGYDKHDGFNDRFDYRHQWTRRPGPDECSAKTSEGFRLHKKIVKHVYSAPSLTECERLCSGQDGFICHTYSYRYSSGSRDNCMLCDRPINRLDYYVDIEPDRDFDIYSMADDVNVCRKHSRSDGPRGGSGTTALSDPRNAQCFFRAIDATRFFKSIVRDSLTVRSVGECEMECIKSTKFTCRAFAFRYGQQRHASVIDNCQLSDWPVRDMDKERHLVSDNTFDIFERASYGHGCEIQPIVDEKHKKSFCYLGYGSAAKLLTPAIKKVITAPSEMECKKECVRFRDSTSFKCYSFSYGSRKATFNCEMSDLDQTELKLNVHYTHTDDREYWLFAWNPFDYTCRDKVNTIGGSRVNNNRRMDIFREPGDLAWHHYSVSGKPCRRSSPCEKNLITGFYSCEIDGGEIGSWDYCCKVDHPCGYSQGFDYPWCFVGDEPDQWRKCSDRYYPGNHTLTHSGLSVKPLKPSDKRKPSDSYSSASTSDEYQKPPRPGGLQSLSDFTAARLWPVTYLYSEGPPNSTEFSNFVDCNKETC